VAFQQVNPNVSHIVQTKDFPENVSLAPGVYKEDTPQGSFMLEPNITASIGTVNNPIVYALTTSNGTGHATLLIQHNRTVYNLGLVVDMDTSAPSHIPGVGGQIMFQSPDNTPSHDHGSQAVWAGYLTPEMAQEINAYLGKCIAVQFIVDEHGEIMNFLSFFYPIDHAQYFLGGHVVEGKNLNCLSWVQKIIGMKLSCSDPKTYYVPTPRACTAIRPEDFHELATVSHTEGTAEQVRPLITRIQSYLGVSIFTRALMAPVTAIARWTGAGKRRYKKSKHIKSKGVKMVKKTRHKKLK
jgi:hypothetical protein